MGMRRRSNSGGNVLVYHKHGSPMVFFPRGIGEVLDLMEREANAVLWAGGTEITCRSMRKELIDLPKTVISLSLVEELARATRTEYGLEIGATMTLERLSQIGRNTLPTGLYEAVNNVGSLPLRNRATIGGHLALRARIGDLHPLLQLLDSKIEIRSPRRGGGKRGLVRKVPIALLEDKNFLDSRKLITKISIPGNNWDIGFHRKISTGGDESGVLIFTALASVKGGILSECRMAFSDGYTGILRDRELEAYMAGQTLPLGHRELKTLDEAILELTAPWKRRSYDRKTAMTCSRGFLKQARNHSMGGMIF